MLSYKLKRYLLLLIIFLHLLGLLFSEVSTSVRFIPVGILYVLLCFSMRFKYKRGSVFIIAISLYFLYLLFKGLVNNNFISYVQIDFFCFLFFLLVAFYPRKKGKLDFFLVDFPKIGLYVNLLGIIFSFYYFYLFGFQFSSMEVGRALVQDKEVLMSPKYILSGSLFVFPLVSYVKKRGVVLLYYFGVTLYILTSLAMASRGTTLMAAVIIFLSLLHNKNIKISYKMIFNRKFLSIIGSIFLVLCLLYTQPKVGASVRYLNYRLFHGKSETAKHRKDEAQSVYDNISASVMLTGKGLGGANNYWIFENVKNGVNSAHFGWVYLILKGGVILVIIVYGGMLFAFIRLWRMKLMRPYSLIILLVFLLELSHTNFNNIYHLLFLGFAISASTLNENEIKLTTLNIR